VTAASIVLYIQKLCTNYISRPTQFKSVLEVSITPSFKCKDIGMECGFEASAWTKGSLMNKISKHAAEAHNMKEIPPDVLEKIKKAIK